ncbi:MAG: hypothetical protein HN458_02955 [Euryarchaeota archaeon]|mgnify:FL=1|jgi:hypothetical protein|nr:hypothetical protein [Euryarchaeota archaeon]
MAKAIAGAICLFLLLAMVPNAAAAGGTDGEDANPTGDVPFTVEERTTPSQDGAKWKLSVATNGDAATNGTTLVLTTQICLNSGICDPPINHDVTPDEGTYSLSLTPPGDHTYVNWRVKATYADDSTDVFPDGDWYKTWSTCYFTGGEYGGIHASGDGCDVPSEEEESFLPFIGVALLATSIGVAGLAIARRTKVN